MKFKTHTTSRTCSNLSPKLRTITTVDLFNAGGAKIYDGEEILADSTIQIDTTFNLPFTFNDSYEIKIGNEYVGYYPYTLKTSETTQSTDFGFSIIGVVMVVIRTSYYILKRKRK
ncbi:MAG: hypothetical protein KAU62_13135 [Candidatus Heimdallarchaeota archaeon]|nr:hypothetical protein [Candidatus Heimdallarchaeota archaeon]MCK4612095.1 hypothetical protein [Candidatus Heimdallarchaeota archaeon]